MDIICAFVVCVSMATYGAFIFDMNTIPSLEVKNITIAAATSLVNCTA